MLTYRQFRSLVNSEVVARCGLGLECLADCDLSDYWDEDLTESEARDMAIEAARDVLYDNNFPF
jgi:hypothetical protein